MIRFRFIPGPALAVLGLLAGCAQPPQKPEPFSVIEASFQDMQMAMAEGRVTSREIVQQYLDRLG